ncbi:hypothetical protein B9Q11_04630 [Candidatus Marsarchaeota G2 archaeon ECH_B_SAG-F08]|jgi:hypothetical protein|uniref:Uncharacterized protein n=7 Tax=Candidatus Marsarchaeota TaxID=1978152 RepID=A0A2R6BZ22_9ARCH|nr:MAG: hypothetical protein B9Q01_05750 [Candidatus Marsarchaeota G1 archaeon OSP_D]PSN86799.1 MAG: hypothetical protein B9Q02_01160 [Candidatus Marsarchaeota G1 archaeon BE_D]PSN88028.1 MAG: hypothetical protein B9Q00_06965 [Candidatus Marsarchaeota G1 archaeon OSP_C]PSN94549.1 MAG: hypothetical protein B9P99_01635 [Candidatus Marsarchaeota G1 archaeon OSP_B]PSN97239.1 MAG: hypothetical protein B9Q11_04630 [Candidatus Marsarchaeota G2 archaeon ECH_B_SAG-F08]PSO03881.1 MAG: hypothetical prote
MSWNIFEKLKTVFMKVTQILVKLFKKTNKSTSLTPVSNVIATPTAHYEGVQTATIIAIPTNIAKAVVNCCLKNRIDLAEAIFRGFGYGNTKIVVTEKEIIAETSSGIVLLDPSKYRLSEL